MSEYMAIDHFGITAPGESWKAVENGELARDGAIPVNPSGGLTTAVSFVVTRED
jgi:acetyl-CoA C-acetyltransferase